MNHKTLLFALLAVAAFSLGCNKEETPSQQVDKVSAETKKAAEEMKHYSYSQKDEFVKEMQVQLASLNQDLDKLSAKVESSSDAVKTEAKPKLQALRDQAATLNTQLEAVKSSTESTWKDVEAGTKKAYDKVADSFQQARQWVGEKIAH
jgi:cytochrome c556